MGMMLKSQINGWTWMYWIISVLLNICMFIPGIAIAIKIGFPFNIEAFSNIFQYIKFILAASSVPVHWVFLPILRFGEPTHCYFIGLLKKTKLSLVNKRNKYMKMVTCCSFVLLAYLMIELLYISYLYFIIHFEISSKMWHKSCIYTSISIIAEIVQLFCIIWVLGYRMIKESGYFYDYYDWSVWTQTTENLNNVPIQLLQTNKHSELIEDENSAKAMDLHVTINSEMSESTEELKEIWGDTMKNVSSTLNCSGHNEQKIEGNHGDDSNDVKLFENTASLNCDTSSSRCFCVSLLSLCIVWLFKIPKAILLLVVFIILNLIIWIAVLLAFIGLLLRLFIGLFLCKNKNILLNIKRYGGIKSLFDYLMFDVLFGTFYFDYLIKPLLEHEPTKYFITHLAVIFFQKRYISFVKSSLPNYNLKHDYITYDVLYDCGKTTYNRLLPSANDEYIHSLPDMIQVSKLFKRKQFEKESELNLSAFLAIYIRFFTHQFANTSISDPTNVNEPVGVNLSQLYGSKKTTETALRSFKNGLLKSTVIDEEEYPMINNKCFISPNNIQCHFKCPHFNTPGYFAIHIIWFRHHQYIARSLAKQYPKYSDEQLFQTAKLCNILTILKLTISLYTEIGVVQTNFEAKFDISDFENLYNTWISWLFSPSQQLFPSNSNTIYAEFNILYRWHQMIPPQITTVNVKKNEQVIEFSSDVDIEKVTFENPNAVQVLTGKNRLEQFLLSVCNTPVGKLTLFNTEEFLVNTAVLGTIKSTRKYKLRSFNDYREHFGFNRYKTFEELNDDTQIIEALKKLYKNVDNVEFYVGIFAEKKIGRALHGPFLTAIFGSFVFSLLTSTKLLRKDWKIMLSPLGRQIVNDISSTKQLISLHTNLKIDQLSFRTDHTK